MVAATNVVESAWPRCVYCCALVILVGFDAAYAQSGALAEYNVYTLRYRTVTEVEPRLAELLADFSASVHLVADRRTNRILLRGPAEAQEIARRLIESVDLAAAQPPVATSAEATMPAARGVTARSYRCDKARLEEVAGRLRAKFSQRGIRVASDLHTERLLIVAPADTHTAVGQELAALGIGVNEDHTAPTSGHQIRQQELFIALTDSRVENIESMLCDLIGRRLQPLPTTAGRHAYRLVNTAGEQVELGIDRQHNGIMIAGAESLVGQVQRLVRTLDGLRQTTDRAVRVMPVRNADPAKVRQAVEAYRKGYGDGPQPNDRPPAQNDQPQPAEPVSYNGVVPISRLPEVYDVASGASGHVSRYGDARLVTHLQGEPDGTAVAIPAVETPPADLDSAGRRLRDLGADVEVEALPDLDVIILRGRDRDVAEMARIIEELERLSVETEPAIEIYPLQHVGGEALVAIVDQINEQLIAGRQGRVSVTPLVKPNALLLIGWGEAVKAVKELIRKLDRPVPAETQLRVFRLRHSPAMAAMMTVQGFFAGRTGLGPRVLVSADPRTNSVIVQASPRDLAEVELLIGRLDRPDSQAVSRVRIFRLENSLAADLGSVLQAAIDAARIGSTEQKSAALELLSIDAEGERIVKSGVLGDVEITPDVRTNALLVTAPAESMDLLAILIEQLDMPSAVAQIKVFQITNGDAASMVEMLRSLLPSTIDEPGPQLPGAEGETSLVPVRFSVDTRTNSIIATGSQGDLKIIEALLLRLDEEDEQQRRNSVYRLKNAPAIDVANSINEFLRSERVVQQAVPGVMNPFQRIESEVVVVPEPVSNSLIISATPRFFDEIEDLVKQLDEEPPQVMIQVLIAEVALGDTDEFGIEFGLQDSLLFDRSLLGNLLTTIETTQKSTSGDVVTSTNEIIQAADNTPGFAFNNSPLGNSGSALSLSRSNRVAPQGLSSFGVGRVSTELGYGGLVLSASSESVSMLVRALRECRRLEVLSRPQIMTLDNQSAYIQIGKRVPRISGSTITTRGQVNTIEMENVGLILGVTPRISPDGKVVMEIDTEKSELDAIENGIPVSIAEGNVIRSPAVNLATAQTTVSAADGETIVLGGLITKSKKSIKRRVPWLSSIPVLGSLFRYDAASEIRTELLVILTPHIIRDPEDAERIKEIETTRMHWCLGDVNELQEGIGMYQGDGPFLPHEPTSVIYPDSNPRGVIPDKPLPVEAPTLAPELLPPGSATPTPGGVDFPSNARPVAPDVRPVAPLPDHSANHVHQAGPPMVAHAGGFNAPPAPVYGPYGPPPMAQPAPVRQADFVGPLPQQHPGRPRAGWQENQANIYPQASR